LTKKRTNISLDPEVYEQARAREINISRLTEKSLKKYIDWLEGGGEYGDLFADKKEGVNSCKFPGQTAEEFLKDFRQTCRTDWNLADSTATERYRYAEKLVEFLDGHPREATKGKLREFINKYGDDNAVKTVRVIYGRYLETEVAKDFKIPKSRPRPKKVPSREELIRIYDELESAADRAAFLVLASSGLRRGELMRLSPEQIDTEERTIYPPKKRGPRRTKSQWVTFFNEEAGKALQEHGLGEMEPEEKIFKCHPGTLTKHFGQASKRARTVRVTPQILRVWFAEQMSRLGVADRYIDALCGRTPSSVLAKHYSDFSPNRLAEVYEEAGIEVLNG